MEGRDDVPIQLATKSTRFKERILLHNGLAIFAREIKFKPRLSGQNHFGIEPQMFFFDNIFNAPKIYAVTDS